MTLSVIMHLTKHGTTLRFYLRNGEVMLCQYLVMLNQLAWQSLARPNLCRPLRCARPSKPSYWTTSTSAEAEAG